MATDTFWRDSEALWLRVAAHYIQFPEADPDGTELARAQERMANARERAAKQE